MIKSSYRQKFTVQSKSYVFSPSSTGGHFVCKLFDIFLVYSVGLIYLMYLAFEKVTLFKPVTSRPANSER